MALSFILDSLIRSVSEGILVENRHSKPLADASGYKVNAIGLARRLTKPNPSKAGERRNVQFNHMIDK